MSRQPQSLYTSTTDTTSILSTSTLLHSQTHSTSKSALLEMIHVVRDSLNSAWTLHTKTKERRLKQLITLEEKVATMHDSVFETVFLHRNPNTNPHLYDNCHPSVSAMDVSVDVRCGPGGKNSYKRRAKRHVTSAIQFLNISTNSLRSDVATIGEDEEVVKCSIELDGFCLDSFQEEDEEKEEEETVAAGGGELADNDDDEDVTVITSSFRTSDDEDIGVSVTTWRRHSIGFGGRASGQGKEQGQGGEKSAKTSPITGILKRRQFAKGSDSNLERSFTSVESESDDAANKIKNSGNESDDDDNDDKSDDGTIEEIVVSMGDIVVRASRSKSVRFTGVKPTMEENLSRANELIQKARMSKSTCSIGCSSAAVC